MKLGELADVVRSKNAGVDHVTVDVMFHDPDTYEAVKDTGVVSARSLAEKYGLAKEEVVYFEYDEGNAFKLTIPRSAPAGSPEDHDLFGAQQHPPVFDIEVPIKKD